MLLQVHLVSIEGAGIVFISIVEEHYPQFHSGYKHSNGENVNSPGPEAQLSGCQDCGATAYEGVKHPVGMGIGSELSQE